MITKDGVIGTVAGHGKGFKMEGEDEWYSVFSASDLKAGRGDYVKFNYVQKGQYNNVKGTVKAAAGTTGTASTASPTPPPRTAPTGRTFPVRGTAPERTINRQNALTNAVAFHSYSSEGEVADIIKTAMLFEAYTCGDTDAAAVLEELDAAIAKIEG